MLKLAVSLDGRVVVPGRRWVTGEESRRRVHELRAAVDAVAVGMGTVRADAPRLDVRDVAVARQPRRLAFGRGPLPDGSELELRTGRSPTSSRRSPPRASSRSSSRAARRSRRRSSRPGSSTGCSCSSHRCSRAKGRRWGRSPRRSSSAARGRAVGGRPARLAAARRVRGTAHPVASIGVFTGIVREVGRSSGSRATTTGVRCGSRRPHGRRDRGRRLRLDRRRVPYGRGRRRRDDPLPRGSRDAGADDARPARRRRRRQRRARAAGGRAARRPHRPGPRRRRRHRLRRPKARDGACPSIGAAGRPAVLRREGLDHGRRASR